MSVDDEKLLDAGETTTNKPSSSKPNVKPSFKPTSTVPPSESKKASSKPPSDSHAPSKEKSKKLPLRTAYQFTKQNASAKREASNLELEKGASAKSATSPPSEAARSCKRRNSPTKKPSVLISKEMADLVDDAFLLQQEIPPEHLERVWNTFSEGNEYLADDDLELLIKEFMILGREAARRQIARQQKAVRHCTKKQKMARQDTGVPKSGIEEATEDKKDLESEILNEVHQKFPAVGRRELCTEAGKTAVKCSQILARLTRGGAFLIPFKQILYPELDDVSEVEQIDKKHFVEYFPQLVYSLSSDTNLDKLSNLAPIRHASSGINLNWRPNSLPVGPVRVKCEFEFGEIEGVPEAEEFNIPENTALVTFMEHLIQCYPQIEDGKEDLEIQLVTADAITCVDADSETILYSGVELLMMD